MQNKTLGVLGGGQLGRMLAHAAQALGARVHVYEPAEDSPAAQATQYSTHSAWDDTQALDAFVSACDVVGLEFENIPLQTLEYVQQRSEHRLHPHAQCVAIAQDRLQEKAFFARIVQKTETPPAPHWAIASEQDCNAVPADAFPAILKTTRLGYDGKGQATVHSVKECVGAWKAMGSPACVLEKRLDLLAEYSVIVARGQDGAMTHLPIQKNTHRDGILFYTEADYQGSIQQSQPYLQQLITAAQHVAAALDYVGVLCVEFFVVADAAAPQGVSLWVNEMAPRPHNSGHYSMNGCNVSQFELQARCLLGLPLPAVYAQSHTAMINLLGDVWIEQEGGVLHEPDWTPLLQHSGVHVHLYGKAEARKGRKMGHINICADTEAELIALRDAVCDHLGLPRVGMA